MKTTFTTTLKAIGNNTGIEVPPENIAALGSSRKPSVKVNVSGYEFNSTVAVMAGKFMISFSAAHRVASNLKGGDPITVTLELNLEPAQIEIPADLAAALEKSKLIITFGKSAPSKRKEFVRQVMDAKTEETRVRRIEKIVTQLKEA